MILCLWEVWENRQCSRSTSGFQMPWRVLLRFRPSSMLLQWLLRCVSCRQNVSYLCIISTSGPYVVAYVGAFSSLFAAIIACTQTDIKRVLAYSTMSQIGYMMLALGVAGYGGQEGLGYMASMFHLFTHAMFKALLFLGAGAIIHAVHSNYMTDMGGLRKYLPITHITFLIACLTIAGIPPFSGFFSKDEILAAAFHSNKFLFAVEYAVAGITAFYMFRLYFSIFWGKDTHYQHEPHEAPATMTIPLIILAIGAAVSGFIPFNKLVTSDGKNPGK